jgi:hypothetical protein
MPEASMTPLARTYPEPAGDIAAQMAALVDPDHPKLGACDDAGWLVIRGAAAVALVQGGAESGDACENLGLR